MITKDKINGGIYDVIKIDKENNEYLLRSILPIKEGKHKGKYLFAKLNGNNVELLTEDNNES